MCTGDAGRHRLSAIRGLRDQLRPHLRRATGERIFELRPCEEPVLSPRGESCPEVDQEVLSASQRLRNEDGYRSLQGGSQAKRMALQSHCRLGIRARKMSQRLNASHPHGWRVVSGGRGCLSHRAKAWPAAAMSSPLCATKFPKPRKGNT